MLHFATSDLVLHCLPISHKKDTRLLWVKKPICKKRFSYSCFQWGNGMHNARCLFRRVAEIQIFEKTYLIVIKDETGLKFKINDSTLFLIGSYAQKLVASY